MLQMHFLRMYRTLLKKFLFFYRQPPCGMLTSLQTRLEWLDMKNFIAELLIRLAEKEEESKELIIQVKAQELLLTALLQSLNENQRQNVVSQVEILLESASQQEKEHLNEHKSLHQVLRSLLTLR